jgi:hypothetical protein
VIEVHLDHAAQAQPVPREQLADSMWLSGLRALD